MSNRRRIKRQARFPKVRPMTADVDAIVDRVMAQDRQFFEQHPGVSWYVRRSVPGEFGTAPTPGAPWVEVTQLAPGVRHRRERNA